MDCKLHKYRKAALRYLNKPQEDIVAADIICAIWNIERMGFKFIREKTIIKIASQNDLSIHFVTTNTSVFSSLKEALIHTIGKFHHYYNRI